MVGRMQSRELRAYVESHPAYGLILWDLRLLHQLQLHCLIIECDCDDHTWRRPSADHEVMFDHIGGWFLARNVFFV